MAKRWSDGERAWLGLVLYIVAYDLWASSTGRETLSMAFYKALKHPSRRWRVVVLWGYITAHLFKFIPDHVDPLRLPWGTHFIKTKNRIIFIVKKRGK